MYLSRSCSRGRNVCANDLRLIQIVCFLYLSINIMEKFLNNEGLFSYFLIEQCESGPGIPEKYQLCCISAFGSCWHLCPHSPFCAAFLALTIITQITSFAVCFFPDTIFLQCNGDISAVSAEKGGWRRTESKGAIIAVEQLKDPFCPLPNIDGKTLIFAVGPVWFFRIILECSFLDWFNKQTVETHVLSYCTDRSGMF